MYVKRGLSVFHINRDSLGQTFVYFCSHDSFQICHSYFIVQGVSLEQKKIFLYEKRKKYNKKQKQKKNEKNLKIDVPCILDCKLKKKKYMKKILRMYYRPDLTIYEIFKNYQNFTFIR